MEEKRREEGDGTRMGVGGGEYDGDGKILGDGWEWWILLR